MAFTYDINANKHDKSSSICLMLTHAMSKIVDIFLSTFLIAYIYSLTNGLYAYIFNVSVYLLCSFFFLFIFYIIFSCFVKKTNRVWIYRLSIILNTIFVIIAVFYGVNIAKMLVLVGFLKGIGDASYWASYNVICNEMVSRKKSDKYIIASQMVNYTFKLIFPVIIGTLLDLSTYSIVAIYILVVCVIQLCISMGIKSKKTEYTKINIKEFINIIKTDKNIGPKIKYVYAFAFTTGFVNVVATTINICFMMQFGTNFSLGLITSIMSIISLCFLFILKRFTHASKRNWLFYACIGLCLIATISFFIYPSMQTITIFYICIHLPEVIAITLFNTYRQKNLKEAGYYKYIVEHQIFIEFFIVLAGVISLSTLLLIGLTHNYWVFVITTIFFALCFSSSFILFVLYEKKFASVNVDNIDKEQNLENVQIDNINKNC